VCQCLRDKSVLLDAKKPSPLKTVYLHIGTHKTGTTSIQRFLARADDALDRQGILYPETGRPETSCSDQYGHHKLYWSMVGKRGISGDQVWSELKEEVAQHPEHSIVLSAEGFSVIKERKVRQVLEYINVRPLHVVVYIRHPVQLLKSAYKQRIKSGTYRNTFVRFVRQMSHLCDYLGLVSRWEQSDGVESVNIRIFDKVKKNPGLEASFADTVGIDFEKVRAFVDSPANTSPPDDRVQVVRWINAAETLGKEGGVWQALTSRARSNVRGERWPGSWLVGAMRPFLRGSLVTDQAVDVLREELKDVHDHFLSRYVDPDDRHYLSLSDEREWGTEWQRS